MTRLRCALHVVILASPVAIAACGWQTVATGGARWWAAATIAAGAATLAAHAAERATRRYAWWIEERE